MFISRASLLAQELGLHSSSTMANETPEDRNRKSHLFWAVYCFEKSISLRLARSSTIRDHEITIPKPVTLSKTRIGPHADLPDLVEASRIYGRFYDEVFSPSAFSQPADIRASRVNTLAVEWEALMASRARSQVRSRSAYSRRAGADTFPRNSWSNQLNTKRSPSCSSSSSMPPT